jgi:hypothetical protein
LVPSPHECRQGFEHRRPVLFRRAHHTFQRIDAAQSHNDLLAPQLFETLRDLIADQQVMRRLLLLGKLQVRCHRADQHRGATKRLPHGLAEIVLGIGACLRVANFQREPGHLALRQPPPQPPDGRQRHQCCDGDRDDGPAVPLRRQ